MSDSARERTWSAGRPVDLARTLAPLHRGAGDPAHRFLNGAFWWACDTPSGAGTIAVRTARGEVHATAWGAGADWLLDGLPDLVGDRDDWSGFDCADVPVLARTMHRYPGLRLPRTRLVLDALVPAVLEQRVTGREARRAWRSLLYRFGSPAPGPVDSLRVPPSAAVLLGVPTWDWHRFGVDLQRQRAIRAAATVAPRLEECVGLPEADAVARLRSLPGVGEWTAAETVQRALGHPDAVSVGDFHIHDLVVHALTGRPRGDDAEMLRLLERWHGQRQRVVRLIELCGVGKPRFAPRYSPIDMRAM